MLPCGLPGVVNVAGVVARSGHRTGGRRLPVTDIAGLDHLGRPPGRIPLVATLALAYEIMRSLPDREPDAVRGLRRRLVAEIRWLGAHNYSPMASRLMSDLATRDWAARHAPGLLGAWLAASDDRARAECQMVMATARRSAGGVAARPGIEHTE